MTLLERAQAAAQEKAELEQAVAAAGSGDAEEKLKTLANLYTEKQWADLAQKFKTILEEYRDA